MYQTITEFYDGKSIFLTGSTGFVGKVLLEKLLYSCTGIDTIYILIRFKKDVDPELRKQMMIDEPVFARIKQERPQAFKKVVPIIGDLLKPNLGLTEGNDLSFLDKVSIVVHLAACVKFNQTLDEAIKINVGGTERILSLCRRMKNLKAFVYVSTAYSNSDRSVIEEVIYPPPASLDQVKQLTLLGISEKDVQKLIKGRPNTYTFSKALAENFIVQNHGNIPSIIIRPAIVVSSKAEPVLGWIDNWHGPTALLAAVGKGFNRVLLGEAINKIDLVPVDYVANLIIVAAAKCDCSNDVKIFHSSTSAANPLTLGRIGELVIADSLENNFNDLPKPSLMFSKSKLAVNLITLFLQKIPAYIADIGLFVTTGKVRYVKTLAKVLFVRNFLDYFSTHQWAIHASNTRSLAANLSEGDKRDFPCDASELDWEEYIPIYCYGIRQFLYKTK